MSQPSLCVVVPCYNEESRLPVGQFKSFLESSSDTLFHFVNDGSTDDTREVLDRLAQEFPESVTLQHLERNGGKAEAVRQGFLANLGRGFSAIAFWDADLATPLEQIPCFASVMSENMEIEMVFGARVKLMGHHIERQLVRHYLGRIFATCASMVLGLRIYDTQCGAKMFRVTERLPHLVREPFLSRWIFDVEMLARYRRAYPEGAGNHYEDVIYEVPLPRWMDVKGSKVKPADFIRALGELIRIYMNYR